MRTGLLRAAMLGLALAGAACLHFSAWLEIWTAMLNGARVHVAATPETVALPIATAACWTAALRLALKDRGRGGIEVPDLLPSAFAARGPDQDQSECGRF